MSRTSELHEPLNYLTVEGEGIAHLDSTCPHIKPRRHCNGRLSRVQYCSLICVAIVLVAFGVIFGTIYALGRSYAKTAINDSDITFSMEIQNPVAGGFTVAILGSIDNRNILDATLFSTVISMGVGNKFFGTMPFPEIELKGGATTPLDLSAFVTITDNGVFDEFAVALMTQPSVSLVLSSKVNVKAAGMKYNSIDFDKVMVLQGMAGFTDPPLNVVGQTIFSGTADTLSIALNVTMDNRSPVSIDNMGVLNLTLIVDGIPVGFAVSDGNFRMAAGVAQSNWISSIKRNANNSDQIDMLVGSYARGGIQNVTMRGHANSTTIPSLANSVAQLVLNTTLNGLTHEEDKLIQMVYSYQNINILAPTTDPVNCSYNNTPAISTQYMDVYMYLHNPFAANIFMGNIEFNVWWTDATTQATSFMAHAHAVNVSQVIAPGATIVQVQRLCLSADATFFLNLASWLGQHGVDTTGVVPWKMASKVNGTIQGGMQLFPTNFDYSQEFITVAQTKISF